MPMSTNRKAAPKKNVKRAIDVPNFIVRKKKKKFSLVFDFWFLVFGFWFLVFGFWFWVFSLWFFGFWFLVFVYGFLLFAFCFCVLGFGLWLLVFGFCACFCLSNLALSINRTIFFFIFARKSNPVSREMRPGVTYDGTVNLSSDSLSNWSVFVFGSSE